MNFCSILKYYLKNIRYKTTTVKVVVKALYKLTNSFRESLEMSHSSVAHSTKTPYRVTLTDQQGHTWYADEPIEKGGKDTAPNPIQLLLSALGACTTITLEMYANHKGIKLDYVQVDLALNPNAEPEAGQNNIERKIILTGDFTEDQHKRLLKVAESCPVHKLLTSNIQIQTTLEID